VKASSSESTLPVKIVVARTSEQFTVARQLFLVYADWLGVDLSYQNFAQELESLPQMYGGSEGRLLLALIDNTPAGCVGVRKLSSSTCEMKRLFVEDKFRGKGIGVVLAKQVIQAGKELGYTTMVLDTLKMMKSAQKLYQSLGFVEIPAYYSNPLPDVIYLKLNM
jgi:carbonic anhydrase